MLKSDQEVARDDVTHVAGDTCMHLRQILDLDLDDETLRRDIQISEKEICDALQRYVESRREHGEMPDLGGSEKAEIEAMGLKAKLAFTGSDDTSRVIEFMDEDLNQLAACIEIARASTEDDEDRRDALDALASVTRDALVRLRRRR